MNARIDDWPGYRQIMLCCLLAFPGHAAVQANTQTAPEITRTIGPFGLSLKPFWQIQTEQDNALTLSAKGGFAQTKLRIESAPIGDTPAAIAVTNALCEPDKRQANGCPLLHAPLKLQWQIVQGKTINGDDAWLGQRKQIVKGQPTQFVSVVIIHNAHQLTFRLSNTRSTQLSSKRYAAQRALGELIQSITHGQLPNERDKSWRSSDKDLTGFYATIGGSRSQGSFSAHRRLLGVSGLRIDKDGRFMLTERRLDTPLAELCTAPNQSCGRYAVRGEQLTTWRSTSDFEQRVAFLRHKNWKFTRESSQSLLISGERHLRVSEPQSDILRGRYRSAERTDSGYRETIFTFFDDGEFSESGFTATSSKSGSPVSLSGGPAVLEGTFAVKGFTLKLTYQDGTEKLLSLFQLGDAPVIEGSMYQRLSEPSPQG
ncbi:MAG: hypothetical protein AB8C46_14505 [Burkholderiaceae bacterium]